VLLALAHRDKPGRRDFVHRAAAFLPAHSRTAVSRAAATSFSAPRRFCRRTRAPRQAGPPRLRSPRRGVFAGALAPAAASRAAGALARGVALPSHLCRHRIVVHARHIG